MRTQLSKNKNQQRILAEGRGLISPWLKPGALRPLQVTKTPMYRVTQKFTWRVNNNFRDWNHQVTDTLKMDSIDRPYIYEDPKMDSCFAWSEGVPNDHLSHWRSAYIPCQQIIEASK
jgi:hypothetical protein